MMRVLSVLGEIGVERARQDRVWGEQNHPDGTGLSPVNEQRARQIAQQACKGAAARGEVTWRLILRKEVYEVLAEADPARLRAELVQVAGVAVAWIEAIDRRQARLEEAAP